MKLVIIEPLGVEEEKLMEIAHKALPDSVEIVSYQTKVTDTESLIERGKDADIIMVANLPLNAEVIKAVREVTGLGLKEAKELVDGAPKVIKEGASKAEAEDIKAKLEEQGAKVTLK